MYILGNEVYWSHEASGYVKETPKKHSTKSVQVFVLVRAWKSIGGRKWIDENFKDV
jgi:hypothetical protein